MPTTQKAPVRKKATKKKATRKSLPQKKSDLEVLFENIGPIIAQLGVRLDQNLAVDLELKQLQVSAAQFELDNQVPCRQAVAMRYLMEATDRRVEAAGKEDAQRANMLLAQAGVLEKAAAGFNTTPSYSADDIADIVSDLDEKMTKKFGSLERRFSKKAPKTEAGSEAEDEGGW